MSALLRAELLKLRTTRTFVALVAAAAGISLLVTVLVALLSEPTRSSVLNDVFANDASSLFILVLAAVGITGEWRHRTITASLLAAPDRTRFLAAKALAYAAAGVALSLLVSVAVAVVGYAILAARDLPTPGVDEVADLLWRSLVLAALVGAFGVGVGAVVRNQAAAIVGLLVTLLLVEPLLLGVAPDVGRFGPLVGAPTGLSGSQGNFRDVDFLPAGAALLVMLGWVAAAVGAGIALLRRRDVT